jgi:hypothetical protein
MGTFIKTLLLYASHATHYVLNALKPLTHRAQNAKPLKEFLQTEISATVWMAISIKTLLYFASHAIPSVLRAMVNSLLPVLIAKLHSELPSFY